MVIEGTEVTNLTYGDDTVLLASTFTSKKGVPHRVDTAGQHADFYLNAKKTKVIHIRGDNNYVRCTIRY